METILFAVGGSIREEGAQSDAEASLEHPDEVGVRARLRVTSRMMVV